MRVPESWLRSLVNPALDSQALADKLTMAGLEVEELESLAPDFSGVVVARVLSTEKHPDADRLRVCKVDAGQGGDPLQIVCGAPNVVPNMMVACATEGAVLPGGFKIKRAKMRGVESQGMLCSAKELGIAEDAEGLLALPESLGGELGRNVRDALALDEKVFTLKLTPNRADCLSILGVAREVAALTGAPLTVPKPPVINASITDRLAVHVVDHDLCGRFAGRVMKGVNAKAPTPDWMRTRLEQAGQRSISALVDISNYVMLELGRPSHIFDLEKLSGPLTVRWAVAGETLTLLNEQTVALDSAVGIIADASGPQALAGVMGGQATAVSLDTTDVFIEAAFWWPDAIRGRARRFNFTTDAGHRFERGVDWETIPQHVDIITHLIQTICGGQVGPLDDQQFKVPTRPVVSMRIARCAKVLGITVSANECLTIFQTLGLEAQLQANGGQDIITVKPPSFRFDLEIEEDLIEEIARIHGFDAIPVRPPKAPVVMVHQPEGRRSAMQMRDRLVAADYTEAITYSFISEAQAKAFRDDVPLALLNPMASHQSVMRTTLFPGLLDILSTNLNRKQSRVRIFEVGRTFHQRVDVAAGDWTVKGIYQPLRIAAIAYGPLVDEQWGQPSRAVDFFDLKADLEALVCPMTIHTRKAAVDHPALHPGRSAEIVLGDRVIGVIGELHPALVQSMELAQAPAMFEVLLEPLLELSVPKISPVSKFPSVTRDLALVVPLETPAGALIGRLEKLKSQLNQGYWIANIKCFDEYRGKGLSEKEKSLAFRFILQSPEATLQDAEVDALMTKIVETLQSEFSARLRN
jgi:phenylalanyl-tRNA synthetase beta chain